MPNIVTGNPQYRSLGALKDVKYPYNYGVFDDLHPYSSPVHTKIVNEVMLRARNSYSVISNRFGSWRNMDRLLTTYVRPTSEDEEVTAIDPTKPVTIVFPYSYAVLETMLTYLSDVFFLSPIFRYEGASPEDTIGAMMLELVIQQHCAKNKVALALHTMFRDALVYGIGPVAPAWTQRMGLIPGNPATFQPPQIGVLFEGNVLYNIDPYCVLPDPGVSIHRLQDGAFFGWQEKTNLVSLLRRESHDQNYFNVRYLKHFSGCTGVLSTDDSARFEKFKISPRAIATDTQNVDVIHMYIDLVPADWGLSDYEYPEKWLFSVAAGEVVIQARPLELQHGLYPIAVAAPDYDGYGIAPISKLETQYGLQHILNWLFNSHIINVRKAVNDMFVIDPYMINIKDLQTTEPGKLIRMRRPAWGKGVRDAIMQLQVADVTQNHIGNASWIIQWMNNLVGIDESLMGTLRQGGPERLTKAEFIGTRQSSQNRMRHLAAVISMQAMSDIGYFFASHAQQLMTQDVYVKTVGEWQNRILAEFGIKSGAAMKVTPEMLSIDYDVVVSDGSWERTAESSFWADTFALLAQQPELNALFDLPRIFMHLARSNGVKNAQEFIRIMPDQQVMQEAEAGNLVPTKVATQGAPNV